MENTQTTIKEETQEKQKTKTVAEVLQGYQKAIDAIDNIPGSTPEEVQKKEELANSLGKSIQENVLNDAFFMWLHLGAGRFYDRAKRRATRKPVTVQKLKNLHEDLSNLADILKI